MIDRLPGFRKRMEWFLNNRQDLYHQISMMEMRKEGEHVHRLLAIPTRARLHRVLSRLLDEREFLSPFGIRSVSAMYGEHPYQLTLEGESIASATIQANRRPAFSGAIRIGADRSGCRLII